jgi:hypothetical protein
MATYRASMAFPYDSSLPKDVISINPHFNGSDPDALAAALKANLIAYNPVADKPFTIKIYDAAKAPPSYPLAIAQQLGTPPASQNPREIALCLSYYTTYNRPRYRGRLFLPSSWFGTLSMVRPTTAIQDAVLNFATVVLKPAMPAQTNWVVWSTTEKKSMGGVTDVWCDDEWDTMRSRGLAPTSRRTAKF